MRYLIGIDEVGRGPLAGPITLCACCVGHDFDFAHLKEIKDSKKLSAQKREQWFAKISALRFAGLVRFSISSVSADEIDSAGLSHCIKKAVRNILSDLLVNPIEVEVRLDGSLFAPREFIFQKTIIKGDEKEPIISAASIIAKVTRDRMMEDFAREYPLYKFDEHKGYGTVEHRKAIRAHGATPIHRKTFLKKIHAAVH
jgi:ribonuclease HII